MREIFVPQFMDRRPYNEYQASKDGPEDWALARARQILETHQPEELDPALSAELGKIIATVERNSPSEKRTIPNPKLDFFLKSSSSASWMKPFN